MIRLWRRQSRANRNAAHSYDADDIRVVARELERRYPAQSNNHSVAAIGILDRLMVDRYRRDHDRGVR